MNRSRNRPKVPKQTVRDLLLESGGKCANPGCSTTLTQLHHIVEWHIHKSHDKRHMIALCGACHDRVHRGEMKLPDDVLYAWKNLPVTSPESRWANIAVQPRKRDIPLILGPFAISCAVEEASILSLGKNWLTLRVVAGRHVQVDTEICNAAGQKLVSVVRNNVEGALHPDVSFQSSPGKVLITVPVTPEFFPPWALLHFSRISDSFIRPDGRAVALEIEVSEAGQIRIQGYWLSEYHAAAVTHEAILVASFSAACIVLKRVGEGPPPIVGGKSLDPSKSFLSLDFPLGDGFSRSIYDAEWLEQTIGSRKLRISFNDMSKVDLVESSPQWEIIPNAPNTFSFFFQGQHLRAPRHAHRFHNTAVNVSEIKNGLLLRFVDGSDLQLTK